jgi:hypothetical protein
MPTLLLRVVALVIIGLAAVAGLEMLDTDRRVPYRSGSVARAAALAQGRLTALTLAGARDLNPLPDSLARGTFSQPDTIYHWSATVRPVRGEPDMYDVTVTVAGHGAAYKLGAHVPETH